MIWYLLRHPVRVYRIFKFVLLYALKQEVERKCDQEQISRWYSDNE